jgi:hypothetical protein
MKQPDDHKTLEIPDLKIARRGRPSTGKARTASQRKRDQLDRDLHSFNTATMGDYSAVTDSALLVILGFGTRIDWNPRGILAKDAWLEIGRRRGFID